VHGRDVGLCRPRRPVIVTFMNRTDAGKRGRPSDGRPLVLSGGRVVDPATGRDEVADVLIVDGKIAAIGRGLGQPEGATIIDARNKIVAPGFVDLHCHLRDPGQESKETVASGLAAAAAGGFTTVCCMPNTTPPLDSPALLHALAGRAAAVSPVHLRIIATVSMGLRGETLAPLAALAEAGAVAFSDDGRPLWSAMLMQEAMRAAAALDKPLSLHEEERDLAAGGVLNAGAVAERLGLPGLPAAAEEAMIARDIALLDVLPHEVKARVRLHIAHVSTLGSVRLVRGAQARGLRVSAEATPHHLTLTEEIALRPWNDRPYDARSKVNPPLRTARDVDAVRAGLRDGVIAAIATDHAPHRAEDKSGGYLEAAFGLSLFETALGSVLSLVHEGALSMTVLVERLTVGPARLFGLDAGTLGPGATADLVVFDPARVWTVDASRFLSQGRNTPLDGQSLRGRVMMTVCNGAVAYQEETFS